MTTLVVCPHCRRRVSVQMIEMCGESLCIKTCEVSEGDPTLFDSLFGDSLLQEDGSPKKPSEAAPVDFWATVQGSNL